MQGVASVASTDGTTGSVKTRRRTRDRALVRTLAFTALSALSTSVFACQCAEDSSSDTFLISQARSARFVLIMQISEIAEHRDRSGVVVRVGTARVVEVLKAPDQVPDFVGIAIRTPEVSTSCDGDSNVSAGSYVLLFAAELEITGAQFGVCKPSRFFLRTNELDPIARTLRQALQPGI
jgi:hypothetical protein